jgi:hypothetical protein
LLVERADRVLRKVLVILLILPILQPKGFCFCRLVSLLVRTAEQKTELAAAAPETAKVCNCGSPNCPHRRSPSKTTQKTKATRGDPAPNPKPECPTGCPAHPSYAVTHATKPADASPDPDSLLLGGLSLPWVAPPDLEPPTSTAAAHDLPPPLSAPLFLLCRDFRC